METFNLNPQDIINLDLKLNGEIPINKDELLALASSWGRNEVFYTSNKNNKEIKIEKCRTNEKYNLSKLDVSLIKDFDRIFYSSNFNGDISKWDVSNATSLAYMFAYTTNFNSPLDKWNISNVLYICGIFLNTKEFNQPLNKWNTSKVEDMSCMFYGAEKFNQNINSWNIDKIKDISYIFENAKAFNKPILCDLSNVDYCSGLFLNAKAFEKTFNNGNTLPFNTNDIKKWLKDNQNKMKAIEIEENKGKELDNFLLNFDVIVSKKLNRLHNVIDSANLNELHDVITSTKLNGLYNDKNIKF